MEFSIGEYYRLEIHWNKVIYDHDGVAELRGCYFNGPVIKEVNALNDNDYMDLDFFNQYGIFIPSYYITRLSWQSTKFIDNKIKLLNVKLKNKHINSTPKLKNNDFIVIDTSNHTEEKHLFYLTYPSYLLRFDGEFYKF